MINDYFRKKLTQIESDASQIQAYNSKGNTVVMAGPGSGKTTVLTLKVMKLLSEEIRPPRGLACLTYSREATREFQHRLKLMGLVRRRHAVFLGTVHSFCLSEVLIPFSKLYPEYNIPYPIKIISNSEKKALFQNVKNSVREEHLNMEEMDKERTRYISGFSKVVIPSYDAALKAAVLFENELSRNGYIDYISMVKDATSLIQNEEYVQKALEAKFPWLIIDEYQDLGKPLHEMVLGLLHKTNIKIFAVGDADQSIYDFQGASPEYLIELSQWRSIQNRISLIFNYRSAKEIVEASEIVLNEKRDYIAKGELRDYHASIDFFVCEEGMTDQYNKTIELIKEYLAAGVALHEIAVLAGYQNNLREFSQVCIANGIPYYLARLDFDRSEFIKWLENCATWVLDPTGVSFDEIFVYWESFLKNHGTKIMHKTRIFYKRELYDVLWSSIHYESTLSKWLQNVIDCLNIENLLNNSIFYPDELSNLNKLKEMLGTHPYDHYNLNNFIRLGVPENQVVLSTRHGAKGLEFDVVILLGMEKDSFPRYNSNMREIAEAHRLCFVSVSRARKKCILLRSNYLNIPTRHGEVWRKRCEPSPFWNMLYSRNL